MLMYINMCKQWRLFYREHVWRPAAGLLELTRLHTAHVASVRPSRIRTGSPVADGDDAGGLCRAVRGGSH